MIPSVYSPLYVQLLETVGLQGFLEWLDVALSGHALEDSEGSSFDGDNLILLGLHLIEGEDIIDDVSRRDIVDCTLHVLSS